MVTDKTSETFTTLVPARLDRLPWSRFHWLIVFALGITWVLDGLEVTLKGAISGVLQEPQVLNFSPTDIGFIASLYVTGAVLGSLVFGYMTDRFGRQKLFFITLAIYLVGVGLTAFSWNLWSFALFRFMTGSGIGGEYAAINSAVDELIPARLRGRIDLIINGSYWLGAAAGGASTIILLDPRIFPPNLGWRIGFGLGAVIGLIVLCFRRLVPESPRWLLTHGKRDEAERIVSKVEVDIAEQTGGRLHGPPEEYLTIHPQKRFGFGMILKVMASKYKTRSILGLSLMVSQAFLYNAIFFTYALVLTRFYKVPGGNTGMYLLPFALGNFLGPLILGHLFDTIGRREMISGTYTVSAFLLVLTGYLFTRNDLSDVSQTILWTVIFFFASPAASSAYLTISEIFPLEIRALAIALFFSIGTGAGGIVAPWLFGVLIESGSRIEVLYGYLIAGALMLAAAVVAAVYGIKAERMSLERVAQPLSSEK